MTDRHVTTAVPVAPVAPCGPDPNHPGFWEGRYQTGEARWDLGEPSPVLTGHLSRPDAPPPGRAIVLGCGRGHDALWLAASGFDVVGIDFAPSAVAAARQRAAMVRLEAEFFQQDLFALDAGLLGQFDYVVEHTCFCAIAPERRLDYVKIARSLLREDGEFLGVFFTHDRPGGPPFGSCPEGLRSLFEPHFDILELTATEESVPARAGSEHWGRFRAKAS
ncbi:MAG: TPMT family class I SAM-dependent methyltransferase [Cyanobacteria bacterium]|nr:TPMT family class I SAM-dependent methyltransferase [Cyanobacteriota bacterium]